MLAIAGIALHLVPRAGWLSGMPASAPLLAVLALAGLPLVLDLIRRSLHGSFGADHLVGISIVASTLLGE